MSPLCNQGHELRRQKGPAEGRAVPRAELGPLSPGFTPPWPNFSARQGHLLWLTPESGSGPPKELVGNAASQQQSAIPRWEGRFGKVRAQHPASTRPSDPSLQLLTRLPGVSRPISPSLWSWRQMGTFEQRISMLETEGGEGEEEGDSFVPL